MILAGAGCSRTPAVSATASASASAAANVSNDITAEVFTAGRIANPKLDEISGLAPSRRSDGVLWVHNDSGGDPALYAITTDGKFLGSVWLAGADNIDWEDMASFTLGGRAYLLVADFGDNNARRKNCSFHVIEEPDVAQLSPEKELIVQVAWSVPAVYPDKSYDCESVAVDPGAAPDGSEGKVYLLTKRETQNRIFTVPLKPAPPPLATGATNLPQTAWIVGKIAALPQPNAAQSVLPVPTGRFRGQPTGMDFSADGRMAVVLTYGDVLLFPRREGETWLSAFVRAPVVLPQHKLGQAEAVCFSRDGKSIYVTEENKDAPLLRYDLK